MSQSSAVEAKGKAKVEVKDDEDNKGWSTVNKRKSHKASSKSGSGSAAAGAAIGAGAGAGATTSKTQVSAAKAGGGASKTQQNRKQQKCSVADCKYPSKSDPEDEEQFCGSCFFDANSHDCFATDTCKVLTLHDYCDAHWQQVQSGEMGKCFKCKKLHTEAAADFSFFGSCASCHDAYKQRQAETRAPCATNDDMDEQNVHRKVCHRTVSTERGNGYCRECNDVYFEAQRVKRAEQRAFWKCFACGTEGLRRDENMTCPECGHDPEFNTSKEERKGNQTKAVDDDDAGTAADKAAKKEVLPPKCKRCTAPSIGSTGFCKLHGTPVARKL
jgi:hypothetical protein